LDGESVARQAHAGKASWIIGAPGLRPDHIRAEIGEVVIGGHEGRTSKDEITLFKSLGLAIEDLASADYLYRKASERNAGTWVEF